MISRRLDITSINSSRCPLHKAGHTLNDCRGFRKRSLQDRQKFLRENRICFKCCESKEHIAKNCTANIKCQICGNIRHATAMHMDRSAQNLQPTSIQRTTTDDGGEPHTDNITSRCTTLCGDLRIGRSCGKTVLVDVYSVADPKKL